jgi:hypothetical protein
VWLCTAKLGNNNQLSDRISIHPSIRPHPPSFLFTRYQQQTMSIPPPPVPPRPYQYEGPDGAGANGGPPPIPPLPPNYRPENGGYGYGGYDDVQPHFSDPLVAPRPQKLTPDVPANVSDSGCCKCLWMCADELDGLETNTNAMLAVTKSATCALWPHRWKPSAVFGDTRTNTFTPPALKYTSNPSRWRARSTNRWHLPPTVAWRRLSHPTRLTLNQDHLHSR